MMLNAMSSIHNRVFECDINDVLVNIHNLYFVFKSNSIKSIYNQIVLTQTELILKRKEN